MKLISLPLTLAALAFTVGGCALEPGAGGVESLDTLVITDPTFTFATQKTVRLNLSVQEDTAGQLVEVSDTEGRVLVEGAFLKDVNLDVYVASHLDKSLKLRTVGSNAPIRDIEIDSSGQASATVERGR